MGETNGARSLVAGVLCVVVLVCCSLPAGAATGGFAMQPGLTRMILATVGVETEPVTLHRTDGIRNAIYISNLRGTSVLIGFPAAGIGLEVPFLLAVNGEELTVEVTAGGELYVLDGDPSVLPADIGDFVNCLVENIVDLVMASIRVDIGGIIGNVLQIVGCVFQFL